MAKQILNRGVNPNDGSGDSLRNGADKINSNFSEIYSILGDGENLLNTDIDFGTNKIFYSNFVQTLTDLNNIDASKYHGLVVHVHATGALYYAHNGAWRKLLSDASGAGIASYTDSLKSVAYTGNYNDLSNRPSLPESLIDLDIADGSAGQVLSTDGLGNFTFRDIEATTVDFVNIVNKPTTIAGYGITNAFSGRYADLIDKPVLFSGNYNDLTNKPVIPLDLSDLTDVGNLLFNGDYNSLTSLPSIPSDLSDLSDNTQLLFSRSYNDLTNLPTSYSELLTLSMSLGVIVDEFSNDTTLIDNSSSALVTERAVKTYVDTRFLNLELTDLDIVDGLPGQVLTTNGAGTFTFQNPGDTIGNFTLSSSTIDTDDSSAITVTPSVNISSDLTVENDLVVRNKATVEDLIVNGSLTVSGTINSEGGGSAPEIVSDTDILITANNNTLTFSSSGSLTMPGALILPTEGLIDGSPASPTALSLDKQVQILSGAENEGFYSLADGVQGQIMYFTPVNSGVYVVVANARIKNSGTSAVEIVTDYSWQVDFDSATQEPRTIAMAIFVNGAWNLTGGATD